MENRDIRIAFFDIDGTLLPPDHHLPESTVAALNILRAKGVQLYLATGRPPYHLHYLKKDLPFEFDGMVMMNGQYCRDKDGCFYAHPLPQEGLRELLPWLEKTDIAVSFVEADTAYMNRTNALCENFLKEIPQETIDPAQRCFTYPTYQLSAFLSSEQEPEFMAHVPGCRAVRWSEEFVDILPATGGKVNGLQDAQSSGSYAGKQHRLWRWRQRYRDACFCRDRGCHGQRLARRPCRGGLHYHRCG